MLEESRYLYRGRGEQLLRGQMLNVWMLYIQSNVRITANIVGGMVNTTIAHMVQSSQAAVLAFAGMREAKRTRNTTSAITPGTRLPTMTAAR
jgi:hypothetical protein